MRNLKALIRKYLSYARELNHDRFEQFSLWLKKYITLKSSEKSFNPTYLPKYEQGQIVFVDFGCGVNREFSYPHYAIVLNVSDRKKYDLLTVVPLTSKKDKHKHLKPWEYELGYPIQNLLVDKVLNDFDMFSSEYTNLRTQLVELSKSNETLNETDFYAKYIKLLEQGINAIYSNNEDIMMFVDKMKQGSIVEINQIRTISKSRIIFPLKRTHALYDIKISPNDLSAIQYLVVNHLLKDLNTIDRENTENV